MCGRLCQRRMQIECHLRCLDTLQIQRDMAVHVLPQLQLWDKGSPLSLIKKGVSSIVVLEALLPFLTLADSLGRNRCIWERTFVVCSPALIPEFSKSLGSHSYTYLCNDSFMIVSCVSPLSVLCSLEQYMALLVYISSHHGYDMKGIGLLSLKS